MISFTNEALNSSVSHTGVFLKFLFNGGLAYLEADNNSLGEFRVRRIAVVQTACPLLISAAEIIHQAAHDECKVLA